MQDKDLLDIEQVKEILQNMAINIPNVRNHGYDKAIAIIERFLYKHKIPDPVPIVIRKNLWDRIRSKKYSYIDIVLTGIISIVLYKLLF